MKQKFDVVIIGGGNAGFGVSAVAHEAGKSVAFIEERDFGGTCPNRGCTPKKVMVAAGQALHDIERASVHGIEVGKPKLDWTKLIRRQKEMIAFIPDAMKVTAEKRGTVFEGRAKFTGPNTVDVNGTEIEGENIVIATGSKPRELDIPGSEHMITSDDVLLEETLPDSVVFVGGGVIAMEFAHVYARAGAKVTILEAMPQLLPRLDPEAVQVIKEQTEILGVTIETDVRIDAIEESGGAFRVSYQRDGESREVVGARVVNGTGRVPNVDRLDLEAANISHDGLRIEVDDYLRSVSNPSVWVVGDALAHTAQLSPVATYEGRVVGHNIVHGPSKKPDLNANASAVYTVPALSMVGLTEQEAKIQDRDVAVTVTDMTDWFSGKTYAETAAWSKVLVDKKTDEIVGAHLVGHHGEELIHLFGLAMKHGITATDLRETQAAFPTFTSDMKNVM